MQVTALILFLWSQILQTTHKVLNPLGFQETQNSFAADPDAPLNLSMQICEFDDPNHGDVVEPCHSSGVSSNHGSNELQAEVHDERELELPQEEINDAHSQTVLEPSAAIETHRDGSGLDRKQTQKGYGEIDWKSRCEKFDAEKQRLFDQLKKARKKIAKLEEDKTTSDDLALRLAKELHAVKDKQKIPMVSQY